MVTRGISIQFADGRISQPPERLPVCRALNGRSEEVGTLRCGEGVLWLGGWFGKVLVGGLAARPELQGADGLHSSC